LYHISKELGIAEMLKPEIEAEVKKKFEENQRKIQSAERIKKERRRNSVNQFVIDPKKGRLLSDPIYHILRQQQSELENGIENHDNGENDQNRFGIGVGDNSIVMLENGNENRNRNENGDNGQNEENDDNPENCENPENVNLEKNHLHLEMAPNREDHRNDPNSLFTYDHSHY